MSALIWSGARHQIAGLEVRTPADHGLTWTVGHSRVAPRPAPPHLVVLHATDGEGSPAQVHRVLSARGLSVELCVDSSGVVYQYLDPAVVHAAHTSGLNVVSVGIEIVCRMTGAAQPVPAHPRPRDEHVYQVADRNQDPPLWIRSARASCWGLYPVQLRALSLLVPALCERMGVPAVLEPRAYVPRAERAALRGVVGHAQVTLGHSDPPLAAMSLFREGPWA